MKFPRVPKGWSRARFEAQRRAQERARRFVASFGDGCSFSPDGFITSSGYVSILDH